MQIVRSWLFVPGNQPKMLDKASTLAADVLIYDIEDSVTTGEKETARGLVAGVLAAPPRRSLRYVRVSPCGTDQMNLDLAAVVRPHLDGLVVPKVESPAEMQRLDETLTQQEATVGVEPGSVKLVATIESARGLLAALAIGASCSRVSGLLFGAEDYALDIGTFDLRAGTTDEMLYARSSMAVAAASCNIGAIDRVVTEFRDSALLIQDSEKARQLGYRGKTVIHPSQIEHVNQVFSPTMDDVDEARKVIELYSAAVDRGTGVVQLDGLMIDLPVVEKARRIVAFAEALEQSDR